jgi:hypothetical protein
VKNAAPDHRFGRTRMMGKPGRKWTGVAETKIKAKLPVFFMKDFRIHINEDLCAFRQFFIH